MGRTFKKGGSSCPSFFVFVRCIGCFAWVSERRVWAKIGEAAMITHAPESKVIAASRLFRARFYGSRSLIEQGRCHAINVAMSSS